MKLYDIHIQHIMHAQSIFWTERRVVKLPACPGFCSHQWVATYWWSQPKTCPQLGINSLSSYKHALKNLMSIASLVVLEWTCSPPPPPQNRKNRPTLGKGVWILSGQVHEIMRHYVLDIHTKFQVLPTSIGCTRPQIALKNAKIQLV